MSKAHSSVSLLYGLAMVRYCMDHELRTYHNLSHAMNVLHQVMTIDPTASEPLQLAALYHDAVYVPGAGIGANEECSAAALAIDCKPHGIDATVVKLAQRLIQYTDINTHFHSNQLVGDIATLLDADLSSLAASWPLFLQHQTNIILENDGQLTTESYHKCAGFLGNFLECREFIFHTEYGRTNWEQKARANIAQLAMYEVDPT